MMRLVRDLLHHEDRIQKPAAIWVDVYRVSASMSLKDLAGGW